MLKHKTLPVTIITGFLGAGKTTLLNQLLRNNAQKRFLIIENEVGNINIDGQLIDITSQNRLYELSNGCICCSLSTELGTVLNSIILSNLNYDHLLIEATGLADPRQIINMFSGKRVQRYFQLDSVVGLVDAEDILTHLDKINEVTRQIAASDTIIINKTDLVSKDALHEVEHKIGLINPFAKVIKANYAQCDHSTLLNANRFDVGKHEKSMGDFNPLGIQGIANSTTHHIKTKSYVFNECFNLEKVSHWFEDFLNQFSDSILRIKGVLCVEGSNHKMLLQTVGTTCSVVQGSAWKGDEQKESKIVFIGSSLDETFIASGLKALLTEK